MTIKTFVYGVIIVTNEKMKMTDICFCMVIHGQTLVAWQTNKSSKNAIQNKLKGTNLNGVDSGVDILSNTWKHNFF